MAAVNYWRRRFEEERDRRYTDLRSADQRALQIKEEADAKALVLAAALQAEKDERRNDILQRWNDDRGTFVTRETFDLAIGNVNQKSDERLRAINISLDELRGSRREGSSETWKTLLSVAAFAVSVVVAVVLVIHG